VLRETALAHLPSPLIVCNGSPVLIRPTQSGACLFERLHREAFRLVPPMQAQDGWLLCIVGILHISYISVCQITRDL